MFQNFGIIDFELSRKVSRFIVLDEMLFAKCSSKNCDGVGSNTGGSKLPLDGVGLGALLRKNRHSSEDE